MHVNRSMLGAVVIFAVAAGVGILFVRPIELQGAAGPAASGVGYGLVGLFALALAVLTYALQRQTEALRRESEARRQTEQALHVGEARNRALLSALSGWMFLQSKEGVYLDYHAVDARDLPMPPGEFIGKNMRDVLPPNVVEGFTGCFTRALHTGETQLYEYRLPIAGETHHFEARSVACDDDTVLSIVRDITERKQTEEALRLTQFSIDHAPFAILWYDRQGRHLYLNDAACRDAGFSREHLLTMTVSDLNPDFSRDTWLRYWEDLKRRGSITSEHHLVTQDREEIFVEVTAYYLEFSGKEYACNFSRDVTERKRAEKAEREQRVLAEALRDIAATLNSTLSFEKVLGHLLTLVERVVPNERAAIMLLNDAGIITRIASKMGDDEIDWDDRHGFVGVKADTIDGFRQMIETDQPVIIPDVSTFSGWVAEERYGWIRSYAGVPIRAQQVIVGFLNLYSAVPGFFTPVHADRLRAFADQAAIAVSNAQLFEAELLGRQEIESIYRAGLSLTASLDLRQVLDAILIAVLNLLPAQDAHIFLYADGRLEFGAAMRHNEQLTAPVAGPRQDGMTYTVARTGDLYTIEDTRGHILYVNESEERQGAIIGLPLKIGSVVVGVMNVYYPAPHHFAEAEQRILGLLASQAAIAIHNARLHETIQRSNEELEQRVAHRTAELDRERSHLRAILDSAGEGIILTDPDWTIRYTNPAVATLTGFTFAETLGHTPRLWQSAHTPHSVREDMERCVSRGQVWQGEVINRRKNGELYDAALTITPIQTEAGGTIGYVTMHRDITHLKELGRLKNQFVSRISHELRTPLANIKLHVELLARGKPDKREHYMLVLRRETERLHKLLDGFLEIAQLDASMVPPKLVPIDVNRLASDLVASQGSLAADRGLWLSFHPDSDAPHASADSGLLHRAVSMVVQNALDYTPRGGSVAVTTASRLQDEQRWVTLTVEDTGPGMSTEDKLRLFERFYRGEASRDYATPGAGLGLAICKAIVDKLNGRITVESQAGHGAAITIWLKAAQNGEPTITI